VLTYDEVLAVLHEHAAKWQWRSYRWDQPEMAGAERR
jgi:hypothetical protein